MGIELGAGFKDLQVVDVPEADRCARGDAGLFQNLETDLSFAPT